MNCITEFAVFYIADWEGFSDIRLRQRWWQRVAMACAAGPCRADIGGFLCNGARAPTYCFYAPAELLCGRIAVRWWTVGLAEPRRGGRTVGRGASPVAQTAPQIPALQGLPTRVLTVKMPLLLMCSRLRRRGYVKKAAPTGLWRLRDGCCIFVDQRATNLIAVPFWRLM